ncbi:hypothetical protein E2P86_03970 [Sphingobacterium psychroaquaticum]|uniref:hypothetical protein n=1 Tax=Sphingobacterium psychroaquaticum TaxID=561061 RepID=UPI00106BC6F4|nr:hypothetical protein [Sphingobacterium psychroaquaticum]QBQ40351.1 hypothetical protein E2P86_03970 [Sphingobacterium psychroaquaticum]
MNKNLVFVLLLIVVAAVGYGLQTLVINAVGTEGLWAQSGYSLMGMYTFGAVASLVVTIGLLAVDFAMPKSIGVAFLAGVMLKAVASYIYIQAGLNKFENQFIELNFLAVFFLFLFFDVFVAYKIVNQQQKTVEN